MKKARCKKCKNNFHEKEIYTIQQFQYRKIPSYKWSLEFFKKSGIDEWDSFCENCVLFFANQSLNFWNKSKNSKI